MNAPHSASLRHWIARNSRSLISGAIVLVYVAFIEWIFGWRTVLAPWQATGLGVALVAMSLMIACHLLRAWRIRDYFRAETSGRFTRLFRLAQLHNTLNVMLPFRSGELSFPMLMRAEFGVSLARSGSALMVMRLLDLHALLCVGAIGLVVQFAQPLPGWLLWCSFLILPAAGYALKSRLFTLARRAAPVRWQSLLAELEAGFPADARSFARVWGITLVNWFAKVAVLAAMLALMGVEPFAASLGGALGGELSSVLPFHAPAGVGTYPAAMTAGAIAFGASSSADSLEILSRASVNVHLLMVVSVLAGLAVSLAALRISERRRA